MRPPDQDGEPIGDDVGDGPMRTAEHVDSYALSAELFAIQERERKAKERVRLARVELARAKAEVSGIWFDRSRVEDRILKALGRD